MRATAILRAGLVGALLVAGGTFVGTGTAHAVNPPGVASLGSAEFTKGNAEPISIPSIADCSVDGPTTNSSEVTARTGIAFGSGTTTCETTTIDAEKGITTTKSTAEGKNFELSALVSARGPRIRIGSYTVTCSATQTLTEASWSYEDASGLGTLPSPMPERYVKPITKTDGTLLAEAIFNLRHLPGDGSVGLTMLQIKFAPPSGITGDVFVGRAACSPTP
ncbi:hypothetical protein JNUCC0626_31670 [Lentzea sp. JNUCC 0626]|uniref:hypothetical protein n=1 Tax=Lentzea sp. JNUCC 0626 TaxID=3367513 RepID=UPI00374A173B